MEAAANQVKRVSKRVVYLRKSSPCVSDDKRRKKKPLKLVTVTVTVHSMNPYTLGAHKEATTTH